ncbi:unnamed protein product, partial [Candidula unifasciata]
VPAVVHSITESQILAMRQQCQLVWESYFSSVDKIINTVLEVVKNRIHTNLVRPSYHWNTVPGAHVVLPEWSDIPNNYPFYYGPTGEVPSDKFTAVIYAVSPVTASSPLFRVLKMVAKSHYCHKVSHSWCLTLGVSFRVTKSRCLIHGLISCLVQTEKMISTNIIFSYILDITGLSFVITKNNQLVPRTSRWSDSISSRDSSAWMSLWSTLTCICSGLTQLLISEIDPTVSCARAHARTHTHTHTHTLTFLYHRYYGSLRACPTLVQTYWKTHVTPQKYTTPKTIT